MIVNLSLGGTFQSFGGWNYVDVFHSPSERQSPQPATIIKDAPCPKPWIVKKQQIMVIGRYTNHDNIA